MPGQERKKRFSMTADLVGAVFLSAGCVLSLGSADLESLSWERTSVVKTALRVIVNTLSSLPEDRIVSALVGLSCFLLLRRARAIRTERTERRWAAVSSAVFAFLQILAYSYHQTSGAVLLTGNAYLLTKSLWKMCAYGVVAFCLLKLLLFWLDGLSVLRTADMDARQFRRRTFFLLSGFYLVILLFFVPGIIKSLSYAMTPYLLDDCKNLPAKDALKVSMRMMKGHKWELFVFHLSFIGWHLLSVLTLGILTIFLVSPYQNTALAGYYEERKKSALEEGIITEAELNGEPITA